MVTTTRPTPTVAAPTHRVDDAAPSLRRTTVVAGVVGAAVTTAAAAVADATGVPFEVEGEAIPLLGFAQITFLSAVVGGLLLAALNRWSDRAHQRFVAATVALTVASCIPSVAWPDDTASKVTLVALHGLAAAIIIPALARRAAR